MDLVIPRSRFPAKGSENTIRLICRLLPFLRLSAYIPVYSLYLDNVIGRTKVLQVAMMQLVFSSSRVGSVGQR